MAVADYKAKQKKAKRREDKQRERRQKLRELKRDRNVRAQFGKIEHVSLEGTDFRTTLIRTGERRASRRYKDITGITQSISGEDSSVVTTASITTVRPKDGNLEDFRVKDGNKIKLEVRWGGAWREVWTMRVWIPSEDVGEGYGTFTLYSDAKIAQMTTDDFEYSKEKKGKHNKGWKCHEITRDAFQQCRVPVGFLAKGEKDIEKLSKDDTSPLSVAAEAYKQEREYTGHHFILQWKHDKLHITRLRRQKLLYQLQKQILQATVTRDRGSKFFTAIRLVGSYDDWGKDGDGNDKNRGNKKKDFDITIVHRQAARRYGYIVKKHNLENGAVSPEMVRNIGRRILARSIRKHTQNTISLSHKYIPFLRRGDAVEIKLPSYGFVPKPRPTPPFDGGSYDIVFITSLSYSIDSTGGTMDLEFDIADPVAEAAQDARDAADKRKRDKKREDRKAKNPNKDKKNATAGA